MTLDNAANLYIADTFDHRIRKVTATTGVITTVAGNGSQGFGGDGGLATSAALAYPISVALDSAGNLYIADASNHRIRKVTVSTGIITTVGAMALLDLVAVGVPPLPPQLAIPSAWHWIASAIFILRITNLASFRRSLSRPQSSPSPRRL